MKPLYLRCVLLCAMAALSVQAEENVSQVALNKLDSLRSQARSKKWKFHLGYTPVLDLPLKDITGLKRDPNWRSKARYMTPHHFGAIPLPSSFDWRTKTVGGLPPIKNQGQCGSCWAFGTVGVMESIVKIREGLERKYSEQYLVDCDQNFQGCSGGDYAHDLHQEPGAVLAEDYPYTATDGQCNSNVPHQEKIEHWFYVGGTEQQSPTTQQIKEAIFQYGPVAVTVAATASFQAYQGGVFDACDGGEINHIVDLVGWDDSKNAWILRNSWGEQWGENGYMWIPYGCSSVGESATYVLYKSDNCLPKPVPVAGTSQTIRAGESVLLGGMPVVGQTYQWTPTTGLDRPTDAMPLASPTHTQKYTVKTKSQCGEGSQEVTVTVVN